MDFIYLYHGTDSDFDEFSNDYLCTEKSIDQYGSGFYFYNENHNSETIKYGGIQVKVRAWIDNSIEWDAVSFLTENQLYSLICKAPNLEYKLSDWGEIEFEGFDNVLQKAINAYKNIPFLECLNAIGNAFYDSEDTYILLSEFVKETGFNCITDLKHGIYVMLRKTDFEIIEKKEII